MLISGFFGTEPTGPNRACGSTASGGFSRWQPEDWPVSPCFPRSPRSGVHRLCFRRESGIPKRISVSSEESLSVRRSGGQMAGEGNVEWLLGLWNVEEDWQGGRFYRRRDSLLSQEDRRRAIPLTKTVESRSRHDYLAPNIPR